MNDPSTDIFLNWLRLEMTARRWTQSDLALFLGVSHQQVNRWLNGKVKPSTLRQVQITKKLADDVADGISRDMSEVASGDALDVVADEGVAYGEEPKDMNGLLLSARQLSASLGFFIEELEKQTKRMKK